MDRFTSDQSLCDRIFLAVSGLPAPLRSSWYDLVAGNHTKFVKRPLISPKAATEHSVAHRLPMQCVELPAWRSWYISSVQHVANHRTMATCRRRFCGLVLPYFAQCGVLLALSTEIVGAQVAHRAIRWCAIWRICWLAQSVVHQLDSLA